MKCFTCLYLTLFTAHLVLADYSNSENFLYIDSYIWHSQLDIPTNAYFMGVRATKENPNYWGHSWRFESIEFKKDILPNSTIKLDYSVEYLKDNWFPILNTWVSLYKGVELLCQRENLDSSVGSLIREVLGIPEGCPVLAGGRGKTIKTYIPMRRYHLRLKSKTVGHKIRIKTRVFKKQGITRINLFTGQFNLVYPAAGMYLQ